MFIRKSDKKEVKEVKVVEKIVTRQIAGRKTKQTDYFLCDGEAHYVCEDGYKWREEIPENHGNCQEWQRVTVNDIFRKRQGLIPPKFEKVLKFFHPVLDDGMIWVRYYNRIKDEHISQVKFKGEKIETDFHCGAIILPGEEVVVTANRPLLGKNRNEEMAVLVKNVNGQILEDFDEEKRQRVQFARSIACNLQADYHFTPEEAWKMIRAAGPGAAEIATRYGAWLYAKAQAGEGQNLDVLLIVLNQQGPARTQLGRERAKGVLKLLDIPLPDYFGLETRSSREFFRVLYGARKFIHLQIMKDRG